MAHFSLLAHQEGYAKYAAREIAAAAPTPLCLAISKGDLEGVKTLVKYGVDVNQWSDDFTPLMMAARYNKVDIMEYLVSHGAKLDARNSQGYTALKYAILSHAEAAEAFLKVKGARS